MIKLHLLFAGLLAASSLGAVRADGPYDITLLPTKAAPAASGHARLVYASSPFGIAVTADGRARYDVRVTAAGLPRADSSGTAVAYVAWAASTDLVKWERLGIVTNGTTTVGQVDMNKFLLVVTAERDSSALTHDGPTVLHGTSPSGWLQSFLSHPLFRGIPQ
jgi:hypothetical protein